MFRIGPIVVYALATLMTFQPSYSQDKLQKPAIRYELLLPIQRKSSEHKHQGTTSSFNHSINLLSTEIELIKVKFPHLTMNIFNETVRQN